MEEHHHHSSHSEGHHHEHHHEHRHRYVDSTIDNASTLIESIKGVTAADHRRRRTRKLDFTSRFRATMQERYLRKRLLKKILFYFLILVAAISTMIFFFAYCVDIQEQELQY